MSTQTVANSTEQWFGEVGHRFETGGDSPFLLTGDGGWYIAAGSVDVFSTAVEGSEAVGRRRHLFRAERGQLLLAVESGDRPLGLLAVGTGGTQVIHVGRRELDRLIDDPERRRVMAELLDGWVEGLCRSIADELPPDDCLEIEPSEHEAVDEDRSIRPATGTLWVETEPGSLRLLGRPELSAGDVATPFSHEVWLEIPGGSRFQAEETVSVLGRPAIQEGLERLHELCLVVVEEAAEEARRASLERLQRKQAADRRAFTGALKQVAETLYDPAPGVVITPGAESDDLLLLACRRVGSATGFAVETPPPSSRAREAFEDPLDSIARASRFRTRQVLLREDWWQLDSGPLLAYVEDTGQPVALLPAAKGYMLFDPQTGSEVPVSEELSETLKPQAYTFYSPFPENEIGLVRLMRFGLRNCGRDLAVFVLMGAVVGLLGLVTPLATRAIFNDIIPGAARFELLQVTLILLVIAFATAMFEITGAFSLVRLEGKSGAAMLGAIWDRLLSLPMPFFRPYTAGNLANRAMGIETIRRVVSGQVITNVMGGVFSLFHLVLLFTFSARLAWWAVLLIVIAAVVTLILGRFQMLIERKVNVVRNKLAGTVLQLLSSIAKLRAAGAEVKAFAEWAGTFSQQRQFQFKSRTRSNVLATFNAGFPLIATLVIFAAAAPLLTGEGQTMRTGDFLAFVSSFTTALRGILGASQAINLTAAVLPLLEQAGPILDTLPEVDSGKADPGRLKGEIDVNHVSFRYSDDGPLVLKDVTLSVSPGEFVALVGPSGSGKSTLLRQLLAFEEPASGSIYYDGQDLAGLDVLAVRSQLGVVLQNGRLMSGDIFTNIVGSSRATLDDAWEAARMAGLDRDIQGMPMGMHTLITEGGGTLSGGQRQRLMISRALVRKPRILFFDEATSALDNRTQAIVTESLDSLQATRIVVAHRLSTIQNADRICVLERGSLVESGSYRELMDLGGSFYQLAKRQMA